ncbi:MAG: hypothetical protein ABEI06_09050 [Halobacteriaceae archaeon]
MSNTRWNRLKTYIKNHHPLSDRDEYVAAIFALAGLVYGWFARHSPLLAVALGLGFWAIGERLAEWLFKW